MTHHKPHETSADRTSDSVEPRTAGEQEHPEPVRPETPRDAPDQQRSRLEDPPKAEGDRDEAEAPESEDTQRGEG